MGMFLNSRGPYEAYKSVVLDTYFVDKTALLKELIPALEMEKRYFCITRPRRFGKSVVANMVGAFFGKATEAGTLFDGLSIAKDKQYVKHLNAHNVIYIDFSMEPENCLSYEAYITRIIENLKTDLLEAYSGAIVDKTCSLWDIINTVFQKTGDKFIFVMDEWDAVFHLPYVTDENKKTYLRFLRLLLKGQVYVELAYMTGILPIAKYSSGSEINMFQEFNMSQSERFSEFFGFVDVEVDELYRKYKRETAAPRIAREDLQNWYDGYYTASGKRLYNPRSVVCALADNQLRSYWTSSGPYDEIFYYIKHNIDDIRNDLVFMISGVGVEAQMQEYAATASELNTKDQIYSAMVVYGLLTYQKHTGEIFIPNKELMDKFHALLLENESLGYIHRLAKESGRMLKATLEGDTKTMAELLKYVHDTESPIFSYNSELELAAVVNLVYLAARDKYRVEREDKAGEGYVDFIFYPKKKTADAIILELKVNETPEAAIRQIKRKHYADRFQGKIGETPGYTGRILAVGISYNKKTKEHFCAVEMLPE